MKIKLCFYGIVIYVKGGDSNYLNGEIVTLGRRKLIMQFWNSINADI